MSHISQSDHSLVYTFHKISNIHLKAKFSDFDPTRFRHYISSQDWDRVNSYDFFQCVDKHAPLCTKCFQASKSPWITPQLKKRMHCKNVLKVKAVCSGNACDWMIFRKCRNAVNSEIKQAKEKFFKDALHENEGNSRMTWE